MFNRYVFIFLEDPERSIPDVARIVNKSWWKIYEILNYYHYKPYKFLPVQNLTEENKMRRTEFCQEMLIRIQDDPNFLPKIVFTDEATFTTAGMFNRKNKHFWATQNPQKKQVVKIQGRRSVNVWCAMYRNRVLGPIIFEGNMNGQKYLGLLQNDIENLLEELPVINYNQIIWQQDGAPAHNVVQVTEFLNNKYNLWIGRHGPIHWPPNSPDLSPLDLFLWGYLKNKIYYNRSHTLEELTQKIRTEIRELNQRNPQFILDAIRHKLKNNIRDCFNSGGSWVE